MYYVYVLLSLKDFSLYTGFTKDLKERLKRHSQGHVNSTKKRLPFMLVHYEAFLDKYDALLREKGLKTGYGRRELLRILNNTLKEIKQSAEIFTQ